MAGKAMFGKAGMGFGDLFGGYVQPKAVAALDLTAAAMVAVDTSGGIEISSENCLEVATSYCYRESVLEEIEID